MEPTALAFRAVQRRLNPYPTERRSLHPDIRGRTSPGSTPSPWTSSASFTSRCSGQAGDAGPGRRFRGTASAKSPVNDLIKLLNDWKSDANYVRIERPAKVGTPGAKDVILTPGQGECDVRRRPQSRPDRHRSRLPCPGGRQLHPRRRHAFLPAGQPRPAEGRAFLRRAVDLQRRRQG